VILYFYFLEIFLLAFPSSTFLTLEAKLSEQNDSSQLSKMEDTQTILQKPKEKKELRN